MHQLFKISFIVIFLGFSFVYKTAAQKTETKPESFPFVYGTYSFQAPGGDLSTRYNVSSEIGGGAGYKTSSNWIFGAEATYIFGTDVKENTLVNLLNSDNQITNMYGEPSQINMRQSGMQLKATIGKIIPVLPTNKNSGILIRANIGFLQHKIYIENVGNNTPQVLGNYRNGYDRMCNGFAVGEFIGWQNFSSNGAYHFLVGFEFTQAFTENRRAWDYATNQKIEDQRLDLIYALKLAWFIPFRQRQSSGYFYY